MPVSDQDVRNAYRYILGRPPEDEDVVRGHRETHRSVADLRASFLGSPEFQSQGITSAGPYLAYEPLPDVDIDADPATIRTILARTASFWAKVGRAEPYWSMGAGEKFLSSRWNDNQNEFYKSGNSDRDLVVALLRRVGRTPDDVRHVVEFGCGVGRSTIPLARTFAKVSGLDFSPSHLDLARRYASAEGLNNVDFLLTAPDDIMPVRGYDVWYSYAVLPHNPPPVVAAILREAFQRLEPLGTAIVILATYIKGYSFQLDDYVTRTTQELQELDGLLARGLDQANAARDVVRLAERHATPAPSVLKIARDQNCWLMDVHEERGHGDEILHLFTFGKS